MTIPDPLGALLPTVDPGRRGLGSPADAPSPCGSGRSGLGAAALAALIGTLPLASCGPSVEPVRTLEARVSAEVPHRPCTVAEGAPCTATPPSDPTPWIQALREAEAAADRDAVVRWAGLLLSFGADRTSVDRAIARLDSLADDAPGVLVALGALRHAQARLGGSAPDLVRALDDVSRALERSPDDPAARFNRALVVTELGLCRLAAEAWREVARSEPDPAWAAEAEERARAIPCGAGEDDPGGLFDRFVGSDLPAHLGGADPEAAVQTARTVARLSGDSTALHVLDAVGALDPARRHRLHDYLAGRSGLSSGTLSGGVALLERTRPLVAEAVPALLPLLEIDRAILDLNSGRFGEAEGRLDRLRSRLDPAAQPWFVGRGSWIAGLAALRRGQRDLALERYRHARSVFDAHGFRHAAGAMTTLAAETLSELGMDGLAWEARREALERLRQPPTTVMLHVLLLDAARFAQMVGHFRAALAFLDEADRFAVEADLAFARVEVTLGRGDVHAAAGRPEAATEAYREAWSMALGLPPGTAQERMVANARFGLQTTTLPGPGDWAAVDSVRHFYRERGPRWREIELLRALALSLGSGGEIERARETFETAFRTLLEQVPDAEDPLVSREFWETAQHVFDAAIGFEMELGAAGRGLRILGLARDFAFGSGPAPGPTPPAAGTRPLVALTNAGDVVYWWRVDGDGVRGGERRLPGLPDRIRAFGGALQEGTLDRREAEALFDAVLAEPLRDTAGEVEILADRSFAALPFSALIDPGTGRFLVEDRPYALRATLGTGEGGAPPDPTTPPLVLAVGDPGAPDPARSWPPPLPGAEEEARGVFSEYGRRGELFVGAEASADRIAGVLGQVDVFHFAGHAEQDSLGRPVLYLATPGGDVEQHPVDELLARVGDSRLQLAVLSACESLGPGRRRLDGFLGPAHPFLEAGVPTVVGTLWEANDEALVPIMVALQRAMAAGTAPAVALHATLQEHDLDGSCCDWASIQVVTQGDAWPGPGAAARAAARDPRRPPPAP